MITLRQDAATAKAGLKAAIDGQNWQGHLRR